jgi:predicted regulator of Ras-like GTPase activity (Roadblock/LC7/MglB family)
VSHVGDLLDQLVANVDGVFLSGLIDRRQSSVLSVRGRGTVSEEIQGALLATTLEAIDGPRGNELLGHENELDSTEVQVHDGRMRYFAKALRDGTRILVLVTERDTNAGLSLAQLRAAAAELEEQ